MRTAAEGESALANFKEWSPELVITDLYMPHMDGVELCRRIRELSSVPIIVLSVKGEERTKVEALDSGADDYVTKPFGIDELMARVRAALRRSGSGRRRGSCVVRGRRLPRRHGRAARAHAGPRGPADAEGVRSVRLHGAPSEPRARRIAALLEAVWGQASQEQPEYLRVFMGQLRKKLEPDPSNPRYLVTEPWVGYRFNPKG